MNRILKSLVACVCVALFAQVANGQEPFQATKEHELLKKDVGTWNATCKMWMPGSDEPMEFEGTETNSMVGDLWVVTDFHADFGGMDFHGHGFSGFNPDTGKYTGTWFDSMSPHPMTMTGEYDAASKTLTSMSSGKDGEGNEMKGKSTVVYKDDNTRVMTMWNSDPAGDDEMTKVMEITYTRK